MLFNLKQTPAKHSYLAILATWLLFINTVSECKNAPIFYSAKFINPQQNFCFSIQIL